jgi:hypothetical protein
VKNREYVDLYGNAIPLAGLDADEVALVTRLRRRARTKPAWCDFRNAALRAVTDFYDGRGVSRKASTRTPAFRIALDLASRLGIAEGKVRRTSTTTVTCWRTSSSSSPPAPPSARPLASPATC